MSWYKEWFDTEFYHLLYKDRDDYEANKFISNLVEKLNLDKSSKILDLACGKGRHSVYLNKLGYHVVGVDLSSNNIQYARQFENDKLQFHTHDMRLPFEKNSFDVVLNLFTSFGYFDKDEDNQKAILSIAESLKIGGILVLDFLNIHFVRKNLKNSEIKEIEGITFYINRFIENRFIKKEIKINSENKEYIYSENVRELSFNDFKIMFEEAGLKIMDFYGDYQLNSFNAEKSERLIFICTK